mmetsp:Transcript_4187/g.6600  ORF Transcript_4187/g.6600 Transcript_4187/m.6600 type:complete len:224 (+) Transcript_4187:1-672(+)
MKEEQAFWMLVQLMRRYRLRGMFMAKNPHLAMELFRMKWLIEHCTPNLHNHFAEEGVDVSMFVSEWLITLFSYTFPHEFTFKVWDAFFVKGFTFILQVSVALLRYFEPQILKLDFENMVYFLRGIAEKIENKPKIADAVLSAAHTITWDFSTLDREAADYRAACEERDRLAAQEAQDEEPEAERPGGQGARGQGAEDPGVQEVKGARDGAEGLRASRAEELRS